MDHNPTRSSPDKPDEITLFLCGDVMTGRGIDQILPCPSDPILYEGFIEDARGYVKLAEQVSGPVPRPVDLAYVWGDALREWERRAPDVRLVNLETSITTSEDFVPKGINYLFFDESSPEVALHVAARVQAFRQERDVVVASIHWGGNWGYEIPENQIALAHELVDVAGVDVVHGHSSHHPKLRKLRLNRVESDDALWLARRLTRVSRIFDTSVELEDDLTLTLRWDGP